jgi:predicted nucleic acid-binding protein
MRGNEAVLKPFRARNPTDIGISSLSLYELYCGVERGARPMAEKEKVEKLIQPIHLPADSTVAVRAAAAAFTAQVRRQLELIGNVIDPYDLMLAGTRAPWELFLWPHSTGEFSRVQGVLPEDRQ